MSLFDINFVSGLGFASLQWLPSSTCFCDQDPLMPAAHYSTNITLFIAFSLAHCVGGGVSVGSFSGIKYGLHVTVGSVLHALLAHMYSKGEDKKGSTQNAAREAGLLASQ